MPKFKILVNYSYREEVEGKEITVTADRWSDIGETEIEEGLRDAGQVFSTEEELRIEDFTEDAD